jgi:voltage-gated potassium channel
MAAPTVRRAMIRNERERLVRQIASALDKPMTVLAFVWLALLIVDFTRGLSSWLSVLNDVIWGLFVAHFLLEFALAPAKLAYLRKNWLTAVSLALPALRVLRVFRAFRALRAARVVKSAGLVRVLSSANRGMGAVRKTVRRRGVGYVAAVTLIVSAAGAAGMYQFENPAALRAEGYDAAGLGSYGEAVWWTAMTMTTMGSDYFPKTPEGRVLGWLLAVYAFAIFGYITATIASFFVGRDRRTDPPPKPEASLRAEIAALRAELAALAAELRQARRG